MFHDEIDEIERVVEVLQDEPECPMDVWQEGYAPDWFGGCETTTGYWIEVEGVAGGAYDQVWLWWDLEIVATERADGSLPEGTFDLDMEGASASTGTTYGMSRNWTATWSIDPTSSTVLRPEATLVYRWGEGSLGGCATSTAGFETTEDGCAFAGESSTTNGVATHALAGDDWRLDVGTSVCGSTLADDTFVDPDTWAAVARTDADGDGCAVEDCDCDDADPTVSPLVVDEPGDGVDADCDGRDDDYERDCDGIDYTCTPSAQEDTDVDTAPPEDTAAAEDTDADDGCGCGGPGAPSLLVTLVAAAFVRRRHRPMAAPRRTG